MPPQLALLLSLGLSVALLWREQKQHPEVSNGVWIPCVWLLILGSRSVSQWLNLSTPYDVDFLMDGSPTDRIVYIVLMASAIVALWVRRVALGRVIWNNPWLLLFFCYGALSVLWSDFPLVALKRWFKSLGDPLIVLVLLSEPHPAAAIGSLLRRCAFVLVPLSIVFIKYFPDLGRAHDVWSGVMFYTGVTTNKNLLGYLLLIFGLFFVTALLTRKGPPHSDTSSRGTTWSAHTTDNAIAISFLIMIAYLFQMADSKTPFLALCFATALVAVLGLSAVRQYFGSIALLALILGAWLQLLFNVGEVVIASAGRTTTFTGRTDIWATVVALTPNPLLGAGFQSFWLGKRLAVMWDLFPVFHPNQAHNGYIEVYINLGWIGLLLLCGLILSGYRTARRRLADAVAATHTQFDELVLAKFSICYLAAYVLYNVTEAVFQPLNVLFIVFLVLIVRYPVKETGDVRAKSPQPRSSFRPVVAAGPWNVTPSGRPVTAWPTAAASRFRRETPTKDVAAGVPRPGGTTVGNRRRFSRSVH